MAKCTDSTNKDDHSWHHFDEPKIYITHGDKGATVVATIAECTECGIEMMREDKQD